MFTSAIVFWAGACLGSFLNVVIYRLPRDQSVVTPRSRCPHCHKLIAYYDNIPMLSWFLLKARCRKCKGKIAARYPAVELTMACLAVAIWNYWSVNPAWAGLVILATAALVAVTMIDWDTFLIPDELSLGLLAAGLASAPLNPFFADRGGWYWSVLQSLQGAAIGLTICWLTAYAGEKIFKKEAMGGGDVKLLAAVGAWSGGLGAFDCLIVASFLGSVYGIALMLRGKLGRADPIPFGPFLSAAAVFNFFYLLPLGFPFV